jgi:CheY-like chemotaxis protein
VLTAESGKEALDLVRDCKFDKIFLDLRMPDMNGAEVLEKIREMNPGVPVVVITGYPDPAITKKAIKLGIAGVLQKPFNLAEIVEAI